LPSTGRDYFRRRFEEVNNENYSRSVQAGIANIILTPVYTFASNIGQLIVLSLGIWLRIKGFFLNRTINKLIAYISNFYNPLRQMAALWANFQLALAAWDRISHLLSFENNLKVIEDRIMTKYVLLAFQGCLIQLSQRERGIAQCQLRSSKREDICFCRSNWRRENDHGFSHCQAVRCNKGKDFARWQGYQVVHSL
jgi:ABC-type multidrug transport system fused ATPase/permease subunit